jgi:hypothetical protein
MDEDFAIKVKFVWNAFAVFGMGWQWIVNGLVCGG